jgi:hypothetical protein
MEVDRCNDPNLWLPTSLTLGGFVPSQGWEEHKPIWRSVLETDPQSLQGVLLAVVKPKKLYIDGAEARTAATTVEAGKMKTIGATFKTEPRPAEYNVVVVCPVVSLFDRKGQAVLAMWKGWQSGHVTGFFVDPVLGNPTGTPPGRLLPVQSTGNCITHRMSGDTPNVGEPAQPKNIPKRVPPPQTEDGAAAEARAQSSREIAALTRRSRKRPGRIQQESAQDDAAVGAARKGPKHGLSDLA